MLPASVSYLVFGDVHLGHKRNKSSNIIKNIDTFFDNYKAYTDLDMLFIAGDLFDDLLEFPANSVTDISIWASELVKFCARNKIKLRILEGTPSHDWKQSRIFNTLVAITGDEIDFKYVDTLYIEHVPDLDINILYVPDEWSSSTEDTLNQVRCLLNKEHLTQVDIAIMHGQFSYQLPSHIKNMPRHDELSYLSIVKYYISIGHIHNYTTFDRIIAQGSFDRLAHNEEAPKGAVKCIINKDGTCSSYFIENRNALVFKTITCNDMDYEASLKKIDRLTKHLPIGSNVRIRASKLHPLMGSIEAVKLKWPLLNITKITLEAENEIATIATEIDADTIAYTPISITEDNILSLVLADIKSTNHLSPMLEQCIINELKGAS